MAIPRTNLHLLRVVDQMRTLLLNMQHDMIRNATTHKAWALAQLPLAGIQTAVQATAANYLALLQTIIDLRNDSTKEQRLLDTLAKMGWTEADVVDLVTAFLQVARGLRDAPRTTYAEIIAACDGVLAAVQPPDSLWPE